jgi:hypothetical protein
MLTDRQMFFGRREELRTLRTRLAQKQSTSVVGMRRVGKSTLLYQLLQQPDPAANRRYAIAFLDLQDARCHTVAGFLGRALAELNARCGGAYDFAGADSLAGFSDTIDRLVDDSVCPVLCLDEFEEFTRRTDQFDDRFFEAMRALTQAGKLAFVTASQASLEALTRQGNLTSPFYNIFIQIDLGLLEPDAAREMATVPFEQEGFLVTSADRALALELGGRHPFYLQMACSYLYDELERATPPDRERARSRFAREAERHFRGLWRHLAAEEQAALKHLAGDDVIAPPPRVLERMERVGLVEQADGETYIFSQAFARQVPQFKPTRPAPPKPRRDGDSPPPPDRPATSLPLAFGMGLATFVVVLAAISLVARFVPDQFADIMRETRLAFSAIVGLALTLLGYVKGPQFLEWLRNWRGG